MQKYSDLQNQQIRFIYFPSRLRWRGVCAFVTDVGSGMQWTRSVPRDEGQRLADGQDVWSRRLEVGVKPAEFLSGGDGVKQSLITGESTEQPEEPLRGECRAFSGVTVVTTLVWPVFFGPPGSGRVRRPAFPAPSFTGREINE
jgi:hypothetical protein